MSQTAVPGLYSWPGSVKYIAWDTHGVTHSDSDLVSKCSLLGCVTDHPPAAFFITIRQLLHPHPPLTLTVPEPECYCPSHISFSEPGRSRRSRVLQVTTDSREVKAADSGAERDIQCRDKLAGDDTWHVTYRDNAGSGLGSPDSLTLEPGPAGDSGRLVSDADLGPWGRGGHHQDNQNRSCWYNVQCNVLWVAKTIYWHFSCVRYQCSGPTFKPIKVSFETPTIAHDIW